MILWKVELLSLVVVLSLQHQAAEAAFLAKKPSSAAKKKKTSALDSPVIRKELENLSGEKVDVEKLKKSFAEDKWATVKTVLGSQPLFNYLQYERGTPLDEDTTVAGLDLVETTKTKTVTEACNATTSLTPCEDDLAKANAPKKTPPLVEAKMEAAAIGKIYNDLKANRAEILANQEKNQAKEIAVPLKAMKILYSLVKSGRIFKSVQDPWNVESWTAPIEDDEEVEAFLEKPENQFDPPEELGELSDIPDWLTNKI